MNHTFTIRIVYFKSSGKYYSEELFDIEQAGKSIYCDMNPVVSSIRQCRKDKTLPGMTGGWEGPILIDCYDGYPVLILGD